MENSIIALQGRGESGKTTSIGLMYEQLVDHSGFTVIQSNFQSAGANKEFRAVLKVDGVLVGVTSKGDTYDYVKIDLEFLIEKGCTVIICACRTSDRSRNGNPRRGSNLAIDEYTDYMIYRIRKSVSGRVDTEEKNNEKDAERLLKKCFEVLGVTE